MSQETLKNKTAKGLFWGGIGSGLQVLVQLILGLVMLRLLSPQDYGVVGVLSIFTAIVIVIQDSGFVAALINKKDARHEDFNAVFWFNVIVSIFMYVLLYLAAPLIARFFDNSELIPVSRVLFLGFLIGSLGVSQYAYISRELMVKERVTIEVSAIFLSGAVGIVLAFSGYAYWAIVIQHVLYFLVAAVIRWFYCPWKPSLNINFRPLKSMFSFSMNLLCTTLFMRIVENIFSVILGKYYNEKQVGYYTQGSKWSRMGSSFITGMINSVAMPVLTQITEDKSRQQNAFRKMLRFGAFISFPLLLGLGFIGEEFLLLVGGEKWQPATPYLQLFCIWYAAYYIWLLYTQLLLTHKKSNIYMWGMLIIGSLQLVVVACMFPLGIFPMIIAYISIYFLGILVWHYFTNKLIGLRLLSVIKDISPYLLVTICSILVAWFITSGVENVIVRLILKVLITGVLYTTVMWYSKSVIVRESFGFIRQKFKKNLNQ